MTIYQPFLNPVKFVTVGYSQDSRYNSRDMDDWKYIQTIPEWITSRCYCQKWQKNDTINLQFTSDAGPITYQFLNKDENVEYSGSFTQVGTGPIAGFFLYEASIPLASFNEGKYYLKIIGTTITLLSEPLNIRTLHANTVLLEYTNASFKDDVIFETGFSPSLRIEGTVQYKSPASKDTLFEDQVLNQSLLSSRGYDLYEFLIGSSEGIPDYLIKKLNRILGCSTVMYDGIEYTKNDGAKFEPAEMDDYPMRVWTIELRERLNRSSTISEDNSVINDEIGVTISTDSKGFTTGPDSTFSILDVN